jgi:hypothetical protein
MRFVILDHIPPDDSTSQLRTSSRHFDLMFATDAGPDLITFASDHLPEVNETVTITRLQNHRAEYLDYEGPVSNNRGSVCRYAFGDYTGDPLGELRLCFDSKSKHFADEFWRVAIKEAKSMTRLPSEGLSLNKFG